MTKLLSARERKRLRRRLEHRRELTGDAETVDWALQALTTAEEVVGMLQQVEGNCPLCDRAERGFHASGCPLGTLLGQVE